MENEKLRILILEDDFFLSRLFKRVMMRQTEDLDIYTVQTMDSARRHLRELTFDLFLCDLQVGRENALNLLIEEEAQLTKTSVCIVSAWTRYQFATSLLGVANFLVKPVSIHEIEDLINTLSTDRIH